MIWCRFEDAGGPGLRAGGRRDTVIRGHREPVHRSYEKSTRPRITAGRAAAAAAGDPRHVLLRGAQLPGARRAGRLRRARRAGAAGDRVPGEQRADRAPVADRAARRLRRAAGRRGRAGRGHRAAAAARDPRHEARDGVFGWTIGNDVSARGWQRSDRTFWRCKNSDTFKPMGPFIVTGRRPAGRDHDRAGRRRGAGVVPDRGHAVRARTTTYPPYPATSRCPRETCVWLGTDETAAVVPGQVVEITIDGIGTLANPVIEEKPP